ncbi:hypothetical protein LTR17_000561 [Elasticomyces elasticus]|nr:hypothetical protein LTR17_000561 [Elasticomyces elasticus]
MSKPGSNKKGGQSGKGPAQQKPAGGNKSNTNPSKGKNKQAATATKDLCIRCPDLPLSIQNKHNNEIDKCSAMYTTGPNGTHQIANLWWGFSDGVVGVNTTLADMKIYTFDSCKKIQNEAKAVGAEERFENLEIPGMEDAFRRVKGVVVWDTGVPLLGGDGKKTETKVISKEALEAAMKAVRQEKDFKVQQTALRKDGVGLNGGHAQFMKALLGEPAVGNASGAQGGTQAGGVSGGSGGAQDGGLADSGQASESGQASRSVHAGMAGGGDGSGSSANTTDGTTNLASRPKGKGPADPAIASAGTPVTTTSTPSVCPRCPVGCPFKNLHVDLLVCFDDVLLLDKEKALKVLWPNITTDDDIASLVEGFDPRGLLSGGEKKVDHDIIAVMMQGLQAGETAYDGVPFTKALAEATLVEYHKKQRKPTAPPQRNLERSFLPPPKIRKLKELDLLTTAVRAAKDEAVFQHGVALPAAPTSDTEDSRYALRDAFGQGGSSIQVYTNHFEVKLPPGLVLYEYKVDGDSPDWKGATRNKRKVFMRDAIDNLPELKERATVIATDYHDKIIAGRRLFDDNETAEVLVYNYKPGTRDDPSTLSLNVKYICEYSMDELDGYVRGHNVGYAERGAAEAMNMIMSKAVADGAADTFMAGNNKFYYRPGTSELGGKRGLIAMRGYYSSVRPGMGAVTLNVNTLTSAFYKQQTIADYLKGLFPNSDMGEAEFKKANKHLKSLRAYVNFSRGKENDDLTLDDDVRRIKTVRELKDFAGEIPFKLSSTSEATTVAQHLFDKYPKASEGAYEAIAVNVGAQAPNEKFYLDSQLTILSDQLYRKLLDPDETKSMIDVARRDPDPSRRAILQEGLASLCLGPNSERPAILKELNVSVVPNMMLLPARVLNRPAVTYGSGNQEQQVAFKNHGWSTRSMQFVDTSKRFRADGHPRVAFLCVNDSAGLQPDQRKSIQDAFMKWHHANGLQKLALLTNDPPKLLSGHDSFWNIKSVAMELRSLQEGGADLVVLILPSKNSKYRMRHAVFKTAADQLVGIKSAVLCEATIIGSLTSKEGVKPVTVGNLAPYMGNYAMKLNLRLGNTNHKLPREALYPLLAADPRVPLDCMLLGADVMHPTNLSIKGTPSVAAVVGSMDDKFGVYSGQMRLQKGKNEPIEGMKDMTHRLFLEWARKHEKRLPQRILFYRDGVSEGQYDMAWNDLHRDQAKVEPEITAVIVIKRHHTRFYPKTTGSHERVAGGNCPPGTTIDASITSPYYLDFFLQSHNPLVGTGKPAHYFVVQNGMHLTSDQLQTLTNNICYLYGRSTTAVSYASPAYYADRLCERGRHYLKPLFEPMDDASDSADAQQGRDDADDAWERGPGNDGNPWHPNLNGTMFWM